MVQIYHDGLRLCLGGSSYRNKASILRSGLAAEAIWISPVPTAPLSIYRSALRGALIENSARAKYYCEPSHSLSMFLIYVTV